MQCYIPQQLLQQTNCSWFLYSMIKVLNTCMQNAVVSIQSYWVYWYQHHDQQGIAQSITTNKLCFLKWLQLYYCKHAICNNYTQSQLQLNLIDYVWITSQEIKLFDMEEFKSGTVLRSGTHSFKLQMQYLLKPTYNTYNRCACRLNSFCINIIPNNCHYQTNRKGKILLFCVHSGKQHVMQSVLEHPKVFNIISITVF
jgi:hypothetical protein